MTAAERIFDPGPGWRKHTIYDGREMDTYIKVVSQGTQQFWVPDGAPGLVAGDRVTFSSPWGGVGTGILRVAQPDRVLVLIEATENRGGYEQWFANADVTKLPDEEPTDDRFFRD